MSDTALDTAMPAEIASLVERLAQRAATMNGAVVGASDGATYTLGYYDQFAADDDKEAASALTELSASLAAVEKDRDEQWRRANVLAQQNAYHKDRAEAAEARVAELEKALDALDRMNRGVDWCDQDEQARRWSAARRALTGGADHD